ncbi:hypothetical protein Desor_1007 [Desulfosporosinus orientis DSM 765]|uniref:Uncharacterized protein n=2 Tax=Desulfosporosinus orientis TaxID=1563 RepID=G7W836_DESOD|nr:hypothetical protein Desor_1007 [Desulfosporosinus orientis DSM 765]
MFDVLFALFLFSLGFGVLFELTAAALSESSQATSLMEGANLAQETMDQLAAHSWSENIACGDCIPGEAVEGTQGKFCWHVYSQWQDIPQLLKVSIEVTWTERGTPYQYKLETLYAVE